MLLPEKWGIQRRSPRCDRAYPTRICFSKPQFPTARDMSDTHRFDQIIETKWNRKLSKCPAARDAPKLVRFPFRKTEVFIRGRYNTNGT